MVFSDRIFSLSYRFWKSTAIFCALIQELTTVRGNPAEKINFISRKLTGLFECLCRTNILDLNSFVIFDSKNFLFYSLRSGECQPNEEIDRLFKWLCSKENDIVRPRTLSVQRRQVHFNKSCGRVLDCTFDELCDRVTTKKTSIYAFNLTNTIIVWSKWIRNEKYNQK